MEPELAYPIDISPASSLLCIHDWDIPWVAVMERAAVFKSNKSQAVRLPKSVALPDGVKRVDVVAVGRTRIITPEGTSWEEWFDGDQVSDDFMAERDQPAAQPREDF
jgi:antitoxin VapB